MKILKLIALMAMGLASTAFAGWTDYATAMTAAQGTPKLVLINFATVNRDSRQEQFNAKIRDPQFDNYIGDRMLLAHVILSGPSGWMKKNEAMIRQGHKIGTALGVSSAPAMLVVNAKGSRVGLISSADGSIEDFLKQLDAITKLGMVEYIPKATPAPPKPLERTAP